MERLIRFFVQRHLLVHVITAVVVVVGYQTMASTPRETFPDVTMNQLIVNAVLPGASVQDVETKLTIPIEEAIDKIDGVKRHTTVITDQVSLTAVEFLDDIDKDGLDAVERDLRTELDAIRDFPPEMENDPVVLRFEAQKFPVVEIALSGPSVAVADTARMLERKLERLDEVSSVSPIGLEDSELRVLVDPVRARELGITLLDVVRAIEARNVSSTGGSLESQEERRQVVLWSRYGDPSEVGETILRFSPDSGAIRVRDVARLELGREDTGLLAHTNGRPGVSLIVRKQGNADVILAVDSVRELVNSTPLPAGVSAVLVKDESYWTRNRIDLIITNGLVGVFLITGALLLFLTPQVALWVMVGIPVVFMSVLMMFPVIGFSVNIVTLTGLVVVLGMVVDDAVVVAERIVAKRQEGLDAQEAATQGALEMARPVIASAITTMLAFAPLLAIGGMAGKMTHSMPFVVVLALLASLLESFLILPAHMSMGGGAKPTPKRAFVIRMEERYRRTLEATLHHRTWVIGAFVTGLIIVMVVLLPQLRVMIFPQDDAESVFVKVSTPLGTPIEQTEAITASIERQIPAIVGEDLNAITARIGHQEAGGKGFDREQGSADNEAVVEVLLRRGSMQNTPAEWMEILEASLVVADDVTLLFEPAQTGPVMGAPLTIHVAGNDDALRRSTALEISERLTGVDGVVNIDIDERPGTPQVELNLNYEKLALLGLSPQDVATTLKGAFHGIPASEHRDLDETTEFRVLLDPGARGSLGSLLELPIRSRSGALVRIRDVVRPVETASVSRIYHRDGIRVATVSAHFAVGSGHTALSMADRLDVELLPLYAGKKGIEVYQGGEAEESRKTTADVGTVALMAFGGITVVIALMLGSFLEAFFVIAIIPFSFATVVLTFFIHQTAFSLFAMMGAVGLAGVVVNSSIVMVDAIHRRLADIPPSERHLHESDMIDAVVGRLRPIIVTSITTLGGVLPMAYGVGGYDMVVAPMSLALGWGLAFSTVVTLFLVPVLYSVASDLRRIQVLDRARELVGHASAKAENPVSGPIGESRPLRRN
ncbi:MAG: efflux RND transporter permease subunit [Candidatus Binatia bacterium]|nr:efflux RND transporter permease subunit [Candidatus Binatia bacterium]